MTKGTVTRRKHVPLRTCIACRQNRGKRELVRVVRTPDAGVKIDPDWQNGRARCVSVPCPDLLVASTERPQAGCSPENDNRGRRSGCSRSVCGYTSRDTACDYGDADVSDAGRGRSLRHR